jgi:uncharacterized protein
VIIYADSSALAKLLIDEEGSAEFGTLAAEAQGIVTVAISRVEVFAALAAAYRDGRLDGASYNQAKAEAQSLLGTIGILAADSALLQHACELAETRALRAYDAVQLSALLSLENEELVFACWDDDLRAVAVAEQRDLFPPNAPLV